MTSRLRPREQTPHQSDPPNGAHTASTGTTPRNAQEGPGGDPPRRPARDGATPAAQAQAAQHAQHSRRASCRQATGSPDTQTHDRDTANDATDRPSRPRRTRRSAGNDHTQHPQKPPPILARVALTGDPFASVCSAGVAGPVPWVAGRGRALALALSQQLEGVRKGGQLCQRRQAGAPWLICLQPQVNTWASRRSQTEAFT